MDSTTPVGWSDTTTELYGAGTMDGVRTPIPDRDTYLVEWAALHGGYDPRSGARMIRIWLDLVYRLARPLAAAGVSPGAVTAATVAATTPVIPAAWAGGRWVLVCPLVVVAGGLLDNLDGAVAVLRARVTSWGYVLDSAADRVCDACHLLALWLVGAPVALVVSAGGAMMMLEYVRARAAGAGHGEIGTVTVGERPTRIILAAVGLALAGAVPAHAAAVATVAAAATLVVCVVGLVQYLVSVRSALSSGGGVRPGR
ncbi:CDP-alcohol phosphatidyltransferase family protein [Frankia sp. Mgl5]|uniref:CDP-alcohol phosphatidyltransferase family protein n=1 Tax=Frankia sp. Mgl5 TaxID=2933793 RepID=UPI00200F60A6|nr:CDP-alcohol phosphatidyltransferase family protein [Frankia sp. Mgl5]MCK9928530.1 CDP-alcohol phosphatidyltransferase family protein [Frankia sp. Mgl5]